MDLPKISLCMVVYNTSNEVKHIIDFLKEHQLISQVVLVDQGSTEEHQKRFKEISDIYILTTNKGNADYDRQFCYSLSNGEFILAMDSDEWILEEDIQKIKNLFKYNFDVAWLKFKNRVTYDTQIVELDDLLGIDPHPRLWRKMVSIGGQPQPTMMWTSEAHQFPQILSEKQIFAEIEFQHNRLLVNVIKTHLRRGRNISPQAQENEKQFLRALIAKFTIEVKKQVSLNFPELKKYLG